jgi:hypothetical protein
MMKFESRSKPLLSTRLYVFRVLRFGGFALMLLAFSIGIGVLGYHYLCYLQWLDALVNASMILTGMGPVDKLTEPESKWFASIYAIYSGVAFLSTVAVFLSPMVHRFLHKLHVDEK